MDFLPNDNSSGFAHINSRVCGVVCVCAHASTHKSLRIFVRTHGHSCGGQKRSQLSFPQVLPFLFETGFLSGLSLVHLIA